MRAYGICGLIDAQIAHKTSGHISTGDSAIYGHRNQKGKNESLWTLEDPFAPPIVRSEKTTWAKITIAIAAAFSRVFYLLY